MLLLFRTKTFHSRIICSDNAHLAMWSCNHKWNYSSHYVHSIRSIQCSCSTTTMYRKAFKLFNVELCCRNFPHFVFVFRLFLIPPHWSAKLNLINTSLCICTCYVKTENIRKETDSKDFHILGNISIPNECKYGVKLDSTCVVII